MKDDLISRLAAIDAIIAEGRDVDSHYLVSERIINESDAVEAIAILSPAWPKTGEWVEDVAYYDEDGRPYIITRCNQCGEPNPVSNFCPNCGARMEGTNAVG